MQKENALNNPLLIKIAKDITPEPGFFRIENSSKPVDKEEFRAKLTEAAQTIYKQTKHYIPEHRYLLLKLGSPYYTAYDAFGVIVSPIKVDQDFIDGLKRIGWKEIRRDDFGQILLEW